GCPWDKKQTHKSMIPYLLEEAWEVIEEIQEGRIGPELMDELGDLLFQVILHAQIAEEDQRFSLDQIIETITAKMVERHPHVFSDANKNQSDDELRAQWDAIKKKKLDRNSVLDGIPIHSPQLLRAKKIGERAASIGFEFETTAQIIDKIKEEIAEVEESLAEQDAAGVKEEIGDLLFAVTNLARFVKVNPEIALKDANEKFSNRFFTVEQAYKKAQAEGRVLSLGDLEGYWNLAKQKEAEQKK
ncbi:MAG: nucleoside triphosphate pyrophosphohydrolase, partial [SAR324 cluster bacterium]|nr:nucleoside triphosphate pyrophosphohydrolase [SAR324 cluster bacterium]